PAGQPSGGEEDPITLTSLSSVVSTLVQKVHSLEAELHDHKRLFKDVVGNPSVPTAGPPGTSSVPPATSDIPSGAFDAPTGASTVHPGTFVVPAAATAIPADSSNILVDSSNVPADSLNVPAGVSSKGKSPMVEEYILVKSRTFRQMEEDRLGEEAAKRLHDEEMAQMERERAEAQRKRQQEVLDSAMYYNESDWLNIRAQVEANASLSKTLLGDDNQPMNPAQQKSYMRQYVKNQSSGIYNTGWTLAYVKSFTDEQLKQEFEKICKVQWHSKIQGFSQTLKCSGPVLEEPSSKRPKSPDVPTPSMLEVPISPAVTSPPSSRTRRKSLGRKHMPKSKYTLPKLDLDAPARTFLKVLPTPLGEINSLYRIDGSTKHFATLRGKGYCVWKNQNLWEIRSWRLYTLLNVHVLETVSGEVLSIFTDVSYPLSVKLMERMLMHKLEIDSDFVGNDLTTAEVFNSPILHLLRVEMVINSPWIMPILRTKELASLEQMAPGLASPRVSSYLVKVYQTYYVAAVVSKSVASSRYIVPTGRVIVGTNRLWCFLEEVKNKGLGQKGQIKLMRVKYLENIILINFNQKRAKILKEEDAYVKLQSKNSKL
nr:JmjC domain-containing protein [Tanacetum cinerariifolium]